MCRGLDVNGTDSRWFFTALQPPKAHSYRTPSIGEIHSLYSASNLRLLIPKLPPIIGLAHQ